MIRAVPPRQEGRFAIVTKRGVGCDGRDCIVGRSDADGEDVWSWHPWAGAKFAGDEPARDGDYEVTDIGESTQ